MGSIGPNSTVSEYGHVAYEIQENHGCSDMLPNIMPADPPTTLGMGYIGQTFLIGSTFSEHGHVAYQIKGNHKCPNVVANILRANPHTPNTHPGDEVNRSKLNFFRTLSCCISN